MKNILLLLLPATCLSFSVSSQVIQQSNTYKQSTQPTVVLPTIIESFKKTPDTTSIAMTPKSVANIEPKQQTTVQKIVSGSENTEMITDSLNNKITTINTIIEDYNSALVEAKSDTFDLDIYKVKMNELMAKNNEINASKNRLSIQLKGVSKRNAHLINENSELKSEISDRIRELEQNKRESETNLKKLTEQNFSLIKNDYIMFLENSNFRILDNKNIIKSLSDTISARENIVSKMRKQFYGIENTDETENASTKIILIKILVDTLKKNVNITTDMIKKEDQQNIEYKSFEFALTKFATNQNYSDLYTEHIYPVQKKITESISRSAKDILILQKSLSYIDGKINEWQNEINSIAKKYAPKSASEKPDDYTAIGGLNKMLNDRGALIPAVTILGNRFFGDAGKVGNAFGQIKLFMGGVPDNVPANTAYNFFSQPASTYGLIVNIGYGFSTFSDDQKKVRKIDKDNKTGGLALSFSYVSKRLKPNDSTTIDPGILHWKTGAEWIIFPNNVLSLHSNINGMFISSQFDKIKSHYVLKRDVNWFVDAGLSTLLNLAENQKLFLKLDLDFIIITPTMKTFINTNDSLIPQFKIDLVKNF